jgi:hypothetical protein
MYTPTTTPILLLLSLLTQTSLSAPQQCRSTGVPGGVYTCLQLNFSGSKGACEWHSPSDTCYNFTSNKDAWSSIGPDAGGYYAFYEDDSCSIRTGEVLADGFKVKQSGLECPGSGDIRMHMYKSMRCFAS